MYQFTSVGQLCPTLCDTMDCSTSGFLSITNHWSLLKLMSIQSVMPSNHPVLCRSFSSYLQSFPASGSFQMSQFFASGGQSIGASASVLPMNIQDWFPLGWTVLISLQSKGLSRVFLLHHSSKASILRHSAFFMVQVSHPFMTTEKTIAWTIWNFVGKVMSLLFNMLSRFVIAFPPRGKSLNFTAAVTIFSDFEAPKNKVCNCFHCIPIYLPWSNGTRSEKAMASHSSTLA